MGWQRQERLAAAPRTLACFLLARCNSRQWAEGARGRLQCGKLQDIVCLILGYQVFAFGSIYSKFCFPVSFPTCMGAR